MDSTNLYQHQLIQLQVAGYPFLTGISAIQDWNPSTTSEEEYYNYYKGREELWKRNIDTYSSIKMPIHQDGHQIKDMNGLNDNSFKESYFKHHAFDLNENFMSQDFYIKNAKTCNGFFGTSNCISSHREHSNFQDPKFSFNGIMYKNSGDSISITGLQELIHSPSKKRSIVSNNIGVCSKAKRLTYSAEAPSQEPSKKSGVTSHSSSPMLKVRKEKLGDRISALHRLVAPFGKTDTASVLTEAIGYIQFLQDQIQTFSMPYMKSFHGKLHQINLMESSIDMKGRAVLDLKSRGLCLVPISLSCYITTSCDGNI